MSVLPRTRPRFFGLLLLLLGCLQAWPASASDFKHGILWEISKPGIHHSYVFGTIHSDDPRVTRLPQAVELAFAYSRSFTGELDLSDDSILRTEQDMLLPSGSNLEQIIGTERYRKCVALMADYGVPQDTLRLMRPWAVALQLNMPKSQSDQFLDRILYQRAVARGLPVYGLESIPEQIAVFDKMPLPQQIDLLDQAIANYASMPAFIQSLIDLYLARDLSGLQAINNQQMQSADAELAANVEQRLILTRNHRMVMRMQARLTEGYAFIAVGALHLPGEQGILNLLEQQGYLVKYVY
jgi:uncharacterized protein YbaP (TraB family)